MKKNERILIIGAGEAGSMILDEYRRRGRNRHVAGFLDDDLSRFAASGDEKKILGKTTDAVDIVRREKISRVIVAMPSAAPGVVQRIVEDVIQADESISLHVVPSAERYFDTVPLLPSLEETPVADLLGREEYQIDVEGITASFSGKTVLVTGAGGSIGSELCRQLLKFGVKRIAALGRGEHSIYALVRSLDEYTSFMKKKPELSFHIADVKDQALLKNILSEVKPDVVFHAAAHKHVPLMEFNEAEALQNNAGGTRSLLKACLDCRVGQFVLVSTDKAVRPTSIMGASKRVAEMITAGFGAQGLKTATVRFGNVIGSRGSVIPLFQEQIERGGPVTVTDPEVTRYFMSIPEAVLLVVNAASISKGGEVFVLDMGEQFKVADVARKLIEMNGLVPGEDIEISFTGFRPGEKKYEELFYDNKNMTLTKNKKIMIQHNGNDPAGEARLKYFLEEKLPVITSFTPTEIRSFLKELVPEYTGDREKEVPRDFDRLAT